MKSIIVCSFLLLIASYAISQEYMFSDKIDLKGSPHVKRTSLPIVYEDKVTLFLIDKKNIHCLQFHDDFKLLNTYTAVGPSKKHELLLGYSVNSLSGYHLLFSDKKKKEFYTKSLSIDRKEEREKEITILSKNERFLEAINHNDSLYIFAVEKFSSILNLYILNGDKILKTKKFDLSEFEFEQSNYPELFDVVYTPSRMLKIQKIEYDNPSTLSLTAEKSKMYLIDGTVYLTFDNEISNTKMVTINLKSLSANVEFHEQKKISSTDTLGIKSNSYLHKGFLLQIIGNQNKCAFQIRNVMNGQLIKEFEIKESEQIQFKNTALTQEGTQFSSSAKKELQSTSQFLKKITKGNIAVSVDFIDNNYVVTIGGIENFSGGGGVMMSTPGASVATPGGSVSMATIHHYQPTMHTYNSYKSSRSVYFKTILDSSDFKHVKGVVQANSFDKINDFEKLIQRNNINTKTIFKIKSDYLFGYYNEYEKKYFIVRFK
ncbi:hypothetical protein [Carboxylicivirga marina]|uniref:hypothetical protein n=1 Tax=Carboxylicivirga marina TaxID=2800988 RepID=UPI00259506DA|nr:hypothetical protein [uncultured Carboxylicivirga sp.]